MGREHDAGVGQPDPLEGSDDPDFEKVLAKLKTRLEATVGKGNNKGTLKIAGDGGLRYMYLLKVYDTAKKAGYEKIFFVPPQIKPRFAGK